MIYDYHHLYQRLTYTFKQDSHLTTALTHRSAGSPNNERLEFLGDALLNFIVAEVLFEKFPHASEGELTRSRAALVKGDTLAEIAQRLELGNYLKLGGGELKTGGWRRTSILADALEGVIGAIYLDADVATCKRVVIYLLKERLDTLSPNKINPDPKTRLQEYLQALQQPLPEYKILTIQGAPHDQEFKVECVVSGISQPIYGIGNSRRRAEQAAAQSALTILQHD